MTTGYRSLNARIHGAIKALCEQSATPISFDKMKRRVKDIAALENGYPCEEKTVNLKKADGTIKRVKVLEPCSLAGESTANGMIVMLTIQEIADFYSLYLYEYNADEKPFRSVAGRDEAGMVKYIAELRAAGKEAEAARLEVRPRWKYQEDKIEPEIY